MFTGPFQYDPMHRVALRAMTLVLEGRLHEALREQLGGTYSVSANANSTKVPIEQYSILVQFGCDPSRTTVLVNRVFQEIDAFKNRGVSDAQLQEVREGLVREFETSSQQNGFLLNQIALRYQYPEDLKDFFNLPELYRAITPAMITDAAKTYLNTNTYVQVTLFPEKKAPGPGR